MSVVKRRWWLANGGGWELVELFRRGAWRCGIVSRVHRQHITDAFDIAQLKANKQKENKTENRHCISSRKCHIELLPRFWSEYDGVELTVWGTR